MSDDEPTETEESEEATPTPQSAAFRRQQYYVGLGGSILAGFSLMIGLYQRFPDAPVLLLVVAGLSGTLFVAWLVRKSVFPGNDELSPSS